MARLLLLSMESRRDAEMQRMSAGEAVVASHASPQMGPLPVLVREQPQVEELERARLDAPGRGPSPRR